MMFFFESSVNIGLRSGNTAPITDFYDNFSSPMRDFTSNTEDSSSCDNFESYLTDKLTVVDTEKNNGRLYLGFATAEL